MADFGETLFGRARETELTVPGLVGIVGDLPEPEAREQLRRMVQSIHHESFYVADTWFAPEMGVYLGWVHRKGSYAENMPVSSEAGDVLLFFSGEEISSIGNADANYLPRLYEEQKNFPGSLNGLFHGVVVDRKKGLSVLFNDRYGMHRLYWYQGKQALYFAVEAKAILAVCPEARRVDPRGLGEFLTVGCVMQNRSLFSGVGVLPPGSRWLIRQGTVESKDCYFEPAEWEAQEPLDADSYCEALGGVISTAMPLYARGRERLGVALTGGLDTRVIMAWSGAAAGTLPCYTFGGMLAESRDVIIARKVASLCGQPHTVIRVDSHFLSKFPHYAERTVLLAEGNVTVANAPDLYVSQQARDLAPAKIVGTWGSELLCQLSTFRPKRPSDGLYDGALWGWIEEAESTYALVRQAHPLTFAAFRQPAWAQFGVESLEQTQLGLRAPFLDNEFVRTVYRAPDSTRADIRGILVRRGNPALAELPTDRGLTIGQPESRWTMSRLWQEFTFKAEYACDMGMPRWLARAERAMGPLRPSRLFLGRHKFLHFRTWYQRELSNYLQEILLDRMSLNRQYVRPRQLETLVAEHINGTANHTNTLHQLLTLELLHRQFIR